MTEDVVLVTGGSGFVGSHVILRLLEAGHRVRTTVRDLSREADVRALLRQGGQEPRDRLEFAEADLTRDAGWARAVEGCAYVHHVASPFPLGLPKHEDDLIVPARDGALRVLQAAQTAGVRRVVLTSSFAAVGYGHPETQRAFTEEDWTDPDDPTVSAYAKSKTLAERAAWDYVAEHPELELATVNPVGIFGPVLGPDFSTSVVLVKRMLEGNPPGLPKLWFGVVDVRDVADLHVRAMADPAAAGQRFLAVSGDFLTAKEMARALRDGLGERARRVPTREVPSALVRLGARFDADVRTIVPELGHRRNATSAKAQRTLGWHPRSAQEALCATGESLIELGLLAR